MSTYFEFSEPSSQDMTSQDSRVPSQRKPMDISEDNEYYEDEVEDSTVLEEEEEGDAWDDSALIAAWDIAVKEYQDFHSIKANKTYAKGDKISETISSSSNNKVIETEESVIVGKEDKIESFVQDNSSIFDKNEDASTSSIFMNTSVKESKQNIQNPSEQRIKETRQIKPQIATGSTSVLTSGQDTSYQPRPIKTTTTYSSYSPGYYSYPPPSATSSTAPIPPHSFGEQFKGTMDTQEDQGESQLPPTEEVTTSYSTNAHDSYYNGERCPPAYGWYSNYYPPPPPAPAPGPQPPPQFYPSMNNDPNHSFPEWRPKPPDMAPPMSGFDDEALTNLIMAWYYSGYYTGLYHGRKGR